MDAESALAAGRRKLGLLEKLQRRVIKNLANDAKKLSALSDMNTKFDALNERPLPTVVLIICASDVDRTTLLLTCSHHNVIPFCFSSHKAARKFLAKEQPWIRSDRKFPLLAYAPRQNGPNSLLEIFASLKHNASSCSRSLLLKILPSDNSQADPSTEVVLGAILSSFDGSPMCEYQIIQDDQVIDEAMLVADLKHLQQLHDRNS
mmetsp:Transcript_6422/g.9358  ORF Transcript_6422/g.9358 Transcript_6422/m.9358 type:complete len:205 (-) Transcript_6422:194-808(-)|eukprot:CAMPEP_0195508240 /NCGR_PEP_ID=MMETSP0794_2-20130614/1505_1 /TAXON_ID=515487 /ORGANISM="Stephanopyxis turris, Strain CCMP 815" /LENGTH=204 /DNA_ID=CAMNT_0040635151 /DNA_START=95 /DNA_END=709 /DNA_ORIENTATION=+